MSKTFFTRTFALVLAAAVMVPAAFLSLPQRTSAQVASLASAAGCLSGALTGLGSTLLSSIPTPIPIPGIGAVPVADSITRMQTSITAGATTNDCITTTIIQPLARLLGRMILQQITASTINWINGRNSSGQPSYVQNLSLHLQGVGDSSALAFLAQLGGGLGSPFAAAITSSLRVNYLQQTSVAGFFAANQNTLAQSSPNVNGFLSGDFSQGGIGAWLALTTQNQNNPYTLYQSAQSQLSNLVGGAVGARQQELAWGQGFLQWCGGDATASITGGIINPQVACRNPDGTAANALTPASVIHDYAQQAVVNSGISQLVAANDLDSALGAIVSALGKQVLGLAGGLFGASQPSASRPAFTTQLQGYTGSNTTGNTSSNSIVQSVFTNITSFTAAWNTIKASANTASASVDALVSYCNSKASDPDASQTAINAAVTAAQIAHTTEIDPLLAQAQSAIDSTAPTQAFATRVQGEVDTGSSSSAAAVTFSNDIQTLATMPPTANDVVTAQQNAQVLGGAAASPTGSLTVSGSSLVDQMNLISTNATAMQSTCTPVAPTAASNPGNGGG